MKLIGLEEHFVTPQVLAAWRMLDPRFQDVALAHADRGEIGETLRDLILARPDGSHQALGSFGCNPHP